MKKKIIIAAAVFVVIAAVSAALIISQSKKPTVTAVVLNVSEGTDGWHSLFLFTTSDSYPASDLMSAGINSDVKITNEKGDTIPVTDIQPGQLIELTYSGLIQETYPGTYADVYKVKVLGWADADLFARAKEKQAEWDSQFDAMAADS